MASSRRTGDDEHISTYGTGKDYSEGQGQNWDGAYDIDLRSGSGTGKTEVLEVYSQGAGGALWDDDWVMNGALCESNHFRP